MKNNIYKLWFGLVFVVSISAPAHAIDEIYIPGYTCPYGATCLTGNDMYWYMMTHYGSYPSYPYYYGGGAASSEEQKKKKEEQVRQCKANANGNFYLCRNDANSYATSETIQCGKLFFNDNLLSQCNLAVTYAVKAKMDVCEGNQKLAEEACNRL